MDLILPDLGALSRLRILLEHFALIKDPRQPHRVAYPLAELLLLAVCGTIVDCDDYDAIASWGEAHLDFLRGLLPFYHGVPGGRWLTIMMNRINPALFSACFTSWVRACWPDRPELIAIDGKTSRGSHDKASGGLPLHLVSAFATTSRLVLAQEAVPPLPSPAGVAGGVPKGAPPDKANELSAIPVLLDRLAADGGLDGALVTIDAIACNATVAKAVRDAGADYLLAVKANQPTLRDEIEALFADPEVKCDRADDTDKGHGRIEQRAVTVAHEVDWLNGTRRFPGELRLPAVATVIKVQGKTRTPGALPLRHALLHILRLHHGPQSRRGHPRPLGHREPAALGARRRLQGGSVPPPQRPRRREHGRGPPLRHQPRPTHRDHAA